MNSYRMRAFTHDGSLYTFSMLDVPMHISENEFVLALKRDSPILLADRIMRGMDILSLFEGDIIESDGIKYVIQYMRGFRACSSDNDIKFLYELKDYSVVGNIFNMDFPRKVPLRKKLNFRYRNSKIKLEDITGTYKGYAIVRGITTRLDPCELQQDAGLTYKGNTVFFGDIVDGYTLDMYYGRPVIRKPDGIYDIIKKQFIGG